MKHRVRRLAAAAMALAVAITALAGTAQAKQADERWANRAHNIAVKTGTEEVKTIHWIARLKANIKTKVTGNADRTSKGVGKKVKLKRNTKVTIVQRDYHEKAGVSQCMLKDGRYVYIPNRYLNIKKPVCTGKKGDYSKETKEAYINNQNIPSGDQYLIWISLDKQRVNIFKGSNHNWKLYLVWKCSTGRADYPTLDVSFRKKYWIQWKQPKVENDGSVLKWYSAFYGSGIHKYPGGGASKALGIKPVSHSCTRLVEKYAKWVYDNTKDAKTAGKANATRVWVW